MARINVDDEYFSDLRRMRLGIKLGNEFIADGAMLGAWKLAERFWFEKTSDGGFKKSPIPKSDWDKAGLPSAIIEVGFAEETEDGVYVRGCKERFQWYLDGIEQRREAGKKSVEVRKAKFGSAIPKAAKNETNQQPNNNRTAPNGNRTGVRTLPNGTEPSSSSSSSNYKYNTKGEIREKQSASLRSQDGLTPSNGIDPPVIPPKEKAAGKFVATYIRAYQSRFPGRPEDLNDGKVRGQIVNLVKNYPSLDRLCQLVQVYFQVDNPWFRTKGYDFETFRNNLNPIGQALDSGNPNNFDWSKVFGKKATV